MKYTPNEAAKLLGVSVPTLHYYEKEALLPPIHRTPSGARLYTEEDIEWLQMVTLMRGAGLSIRDIRAYITLLLQGPTTMQERLGLITSYRQSLEEKLYQMQLSLQLITAKESFYQTSLATGEAATCKNFTEEWASFKAAQRKGAKA